MKTIEPMKTFELRVEGLRSLKSVVWKPGDLNVVIGPNGAGKSNRLQLLELVFASARPILAESAIESSKRSQVILTTHSPQMLDAFSDVAPTTTVALWDGGQTVLKTLEGGVLARWLEEYSLGKLFQPNVQSTLEATRSQPEAVNFDEPPARLLDRLYKQMTGKKYKKVVDGIDPFGKLDPVNAYFACPNLRLLLGEMHSLAKAAGP